jgi:quercetin dioxygenase-like cupin family protein
LRRDVALSEKPAHAATVSQARGPIPTYGTCVSIPLQITAETFTGLSLAPIVDELLASSELAREGKTARTLIKGRALTVVLTALRAGASLHEHAAPGSVLVVPIRGEVTFDHAEQSSRVATDGEAVTLMGPGVRHSVRAHTNSAFLLIVGAREG